MEAQRLSDRRRDKAFEAAGWTVIIVDKADQKDSFAAAIRKIRRAVKNSVADATVASGFANGD